MANFPRGFERDSPLFVSPHRGSHVATTQAEFCYNGTMSRQTFFGVSGTIFGSVAILHIARLVRQWPVRIGAFEAPMWISWVAAAAAGYLAVSAFRLTRR